MTICYEFAFRLAVRKKNGRLFKNHSVNGIGFTFQNALWDVYHTLKKRKAEIVTILSVRPLRVAFAFNSQQQSIKINIADHPPDIPGDLNRELEMLPKKRIEEPVKAFIWEEEPTFYFILKRPYNG
ncbi:hypothetical protein SAMN05192574_101656 [Mucilaginibacter gossypiicola]|uniref:Uncharacterized protein n=1 Tax=Mucilaginibacter gossypiicola TaxID=551995 RepID=A0A1H8ATU6_9SPHI|nr:MULTISPECIES: hypothetical protein [Mucilaginibacter]UOE52258.1 hypothetical protein MTO98_14335 [Mucilaginibacter sp. SMC90]SEM73936.1 hypothetical protein SAMN05192574_101656 [Mucilaginibacter gossypiicola]